MQTKHHMGSSCKLVVASAQLLSRASIRANISRIVLAIEDAAAQKAALVVCPECAVSGYTIDAIRNFDETDMQSWEAIMDACKTHKIAAVVGTPMITKQGP